MARWPTVVEGEGDRPRAIGRDVDPGARLARPPEVVAWGRVEGVPWLIQAFVTAAGPEGKWWEHGPVGPGLEFALGKDGWFGGGEAGTNGFDVLVGLGGNDRLDGGGAFDLADFETSVTAVMANLSTGTATGEVRTSPWKSPARFWIWT